MTTYNDKLVRGEELEAILEAHAAENQKMTEADLIAIHERQQYEKIKIGFYGNFDNGTVDEYGTPQSTSYDRATGPATIVEGSLDGLIAIPDTLVRFGFGITAWYSKQGGLGKMLSIGGKMSARQIVENCEYDETHDCYLVWGRFTQKKYTVMYDTQGGNFVSPKTNCTIGTKNLTTSKTPTRSGYTFGGYNTNPDGSGLNVDSTITIGNIIGHTVGYYQLLIVLYAQWTEVQ